MSVYGFATVAFLLAVAWVSYSRRLPGGVRISPEFSKISPEDYDKAMRAAERFENERQKRKPEIWVLETNRFLFEKYCREIEMRLPNDIALQSTLKAEIDEAVIALQDHVQRARKRSPTDLTLSFPYPFEPYFERNYFTDPM